MGRPRNAVEGIDPFGEHGAMPPASGGIVPPLDSSTPIGGEVAALQSQNTALRQKLEDAMVENDDLKMKLAAALAAPRAASDDLQPFDPSFAHRMSANFAGVVGPGSTLHLVEGTVVSDPYTLGLLHTAGARMARV